MTIAVVWQEDNVLWCAADTRLVAGSKNAVTTEVSSKIYSIPVVTSSQMPNSLSRIPHYWTQFGFTFAGSSAPATLTALTAANLLSKLVRFGERSNPPTFEELANFMFRLAEMYMKEKRQFVDDSVFSAAFFGWCPHTNSFKVAHIDGRTECGFRVELSFPPAPTDQNEPWLVLGSGKSAFMAEVRAHKDLGRTPTGRVPLHVISRMIVEGSEPSVGGAVSIGAAHEKGFDLFYRLEPGNAGAGANRLFNGLDLDAVGSVGEYFIGATGLA